MLNKTDFESILGDLSFPQWDILLRYDDKRPCLQISCEDDICSVTGEPLSWRGRKWFLSPHMCRSEVVQTAFKAVMCAMEHEVKESFRYKGEQIYDPHFDVDLLADIVRQGQHQDVRS